MNRKSKHGDKAYQITQALSLKRDFGVRTAAIYLACMGWSVEAAIYLLARP